MSRGQSNRYHILTEAADKLTQRQGYRQTTLSDIAKEANIPLGNVYYHFKTKDEIGQALIRCRANRFATLLTSWNNLPDPRMRILGFLDAIDDIAPALAQNGCDIGGLCQELNKAGERLAANAAELFADILTWLEEQFELMGLGNRSRALAVHVLSVTQGAILLSHTFKTVDHITAETQRLRQELQAII